MNNLKTLTAALVATFSFAASSSAVSWNAADNGLDNPKGSFSATGGSLVVDTKNHVTFVGVTTGPAGTEIDEGQSVAITFAESMIFKSLTFGLIFNGDEYEDDVEIAAATADGLVTYTLSVIGENMAVWSYAGSTVTNLLPTQLNKGGVFEILNPFGSMSVTELVLSPVSNGAKGKSDFGLVAFEVPDSASTLGLLGFSILCLSAFARRRK